VRAEREPRGGGASETRKANIMKIAFLTVIFASLAFGGAALGDTLTLRNGDHLTGTIVSSDGKVVTFKTDYAGEIKVQWSAVKESTTEKPLYVVKKDKTTVNGTVTTEDSNIDVHTANAGTVAVLLSDVTIIRSPEQQQAYEKSLHPSLAEDWKGAANFGFAMARGNSDTSNLNIGFNADRKTTSDEIKMYASSIYSTTGVIAGGTVTANEILGGVRYDKDINPRLFAFVSGDFLHNALQSLNLQQIYGAGLGWHAINQPTTTLDLLAGINYTRESYSGATVAGGASTNVNRNFPALTLGEDFTKKLGKANSFNEHFYFYPDLSDTSQYRFSLDAGWATQIQRWIGWQLTVSDRYISNPPILGTKKNDVVLTTGINVSFGAK
jgi:putative salt-induced outer membrane protein